MSCENNFAENFLPEAESFLSNISTSGDFAKELEGYLEVLDSATSEAQDDLNKLLFLSPNDNQKKLTPRRNGSSGGANRKRERQLISDNLSNAKGKSTKKRRGTVFVGESSASQQPEPIRKDESLEELLDEKKSVPQKIKILRDRVDRRIKNHKLADSLSGFYLMWSVVKNKVLKVYQPITDSLNDIKRQWPAGSGLENIKNKLKKIEDEYKVLAKMEVKQAAGLAEMEDEMKQRLVEVEEEIKSSDKQRREDSAEAENLQNIFMTVGVSVETLRDKLYSAFPWLFSEEIATNGPAAGQNQGSLQTHEQLQYTDSDLENSPNELFAKDNNKVDVSHFQGLKEAIENTTGRNVPDYLKPLALEIREARGKATEFVHGDIEVLVCAALHEMRNLPFGKFNWDKLKKWGATFNKAKELGFPVEFAEEELNFLLVTMLTQKTDDTKKRVGIRS